VQAKEKRVFDGMGVWAQAAVGLGFIFAMTSAGSAVVFFFRQAQSAWMQRAFLGFAAGIMIAASVFSLLIPAVEAARAAGQPGWVPAGGGLLIGIGFLMLLDVAIPHLHLDSKATPEGPRSRAKRTTLMVSAVTLHNIPEGMALGLSFALAAQQGADPSLKAAALALALGIGIQNFPEGAAVSLPLRQEGLSSWRAFLLGVASGAVEPLFGALTVAASSLIAPLMPWLLSAAAGAMLYVVVEELIPEAQLGEHSHLGTLSVMGGFLLMMVLDLL
jgi:ZIP family zinc transporter